MRRFFAILLFVAFSLPVVSPLLALGQDIDSKLPLCCRRNGAHHCAMGLSSTDKPVVAARCAEYQQPSALVPHAHIIVLHTNRETLEAPVTHALVVRAAETQRRIARERSRHKRGPPANYLS